MRLSSRRKLPAGNGLKGSAGRRERHNNGKTLLLPGTAPKLHSSDEVPSWYAHNAYILTGYRPVTHSLQSCIRSLAYTHNETVNIYSHLVPAALALLCNYCFGSYFPSRFPQASWADQLVFHIYLSTSTICFGTSSAYHTLLCHSEHCAVLWSRLDYVGIIFQILGTFVSGIYVGFYCEPNLQKLYWAMVSKSQWPISSYC
jgi:adiponectin receptor